LDRRTDDPDSSGGASPTVVTSRQDGDDPPTGNGQDTRPVEGAVADGTPANDGSALAADAVGTPAFGSSAFDASAFSFSPQISAPDSPGLDSWSTGPVSWSLSDPDELSAAPFAADPPPVTWPPAPPPNPDPPAVSAAAFTWETPDPPPTSPSSPARAFLRSAGPGKTTVPARPPVTFGPPNAAAVQSPAPVRNPAPTRKAPPKIASRRSVRQAHLTIARVEPWSVMKFSFVVSLVAFIILFVVVTVLWGALSALGVFDSLQRVVSNVTSSQDSAGVSAAHWFSASRVLGWTALLGSLNIVLITAMSTIGAVVYNLTSRVVGGVEVTLRETE